MHLIYFWGELTISVDISRDVDPQFRSLPELYHRHTYLFEAKVIHRPPAPPGVDAVGEGIDVRASDLRPPLSVSRLS